MDVGSLDSLRRGLKHIDSELTVESLASDGTGLFRLDCDYDEDDDENDNGNDDQGEVILNKREDHADTIEDGEERMPYVETEREKDSTKNHNNEEIIENKEDTGSTQKTSSNMKNNSSLAEKLARRYVHNRSASDGSKKPEDEG